MCLHTYSVTATRCLYTGSVSPPVNILNVCAGGSTSIGCKTCQAMQTTFNAYLSAMDAGAASCGSSAPDRLLGQVTLLRMALRQTLSAKHICNMVANDFMPSSGPQLASQASLLANSSLAICQAVTGPSASFICGDGRCAECSANLDEFKTLVAAGKASATKAGVLDFCIAKNIADEDFTSIIQVCMLWRGVSGRGYLGGLVGGYVGGCRCHQIHCTVSMHIAQHTHSHCSQGFCSLNVSACMCPLSAGCWRLQPRGQLCRSSNPS